MSIKATDEFCIVVPNNYVLYLSKGEREGGRREKERKRERERQREREGGGGGGGGGEGGGGIASSCLTVHYMTH